MPLKTKIHYYMPLSCGIRILGQLDAGKDDGLLPAENAKKVARQVARHRFITKTEGSVPWTYTYDPNKYGTVLLSHRKGDKYCKALCDLIRKERLGTITKSPAVTNPNVGTTIETFIWNINHTNLMKFNVPEPKKPRPKYNW